MRGRDVRDHAGRMPALLAAVALLVAVLAPSADATGHATSPAGGGSPAAAIRAAGTVPTKLAPDTQASSLRSRAGLRLEPQIERLHYRYGPLTVAGHEHDHDRRRHCPSRPSTATSSASGPTSP